MNTNYYQFEHDDIGNRTYAEFPNHEEEYDSDNQNAYTEINTYSPAFTYDKFAYDLDGNMLTNQIRYSNNVWAYTWNGENRMTSATNCVDGTYVTYKYDYQGRMFEKTTNGDVTRFLWNGNHIISEMTDSTTNLYVWANGEILTASLNGETVFYCHDANKNVTDLVDTSGDSVAHYEYSPFGVIIDQKYALAEANPFRFSNEYFDSDIKKVVYLFRVYDPWLAKFLSLDPIEEKGGKNLYGIGDNDLINFVDWWGLSEDENVGAIAVSTPKLAPAEERCKGCCRLYIIFQYNPDFSTRDKTLASNNDIKTLAIKDMKRYKLQSKVIKVHNRVIEDVGKGASILKAHIQKVGRLKECKNGIAVIIYGHGNEKNGLYYPINAADYPDLPPDTGELFPQPPYLPSPTKPAAPGFGGTTWNELWKNVEAMHIKSCYSSLDEDEFKNILFTGYKGIYYGGSENDEPKSH